MNEKTYTIRELLEKCSSKRVENTLEYRKAVQESNERLKEYEQQQAKMYREADKFVANSNSIETKEKSLTKKLK